MNQNKFLAYIISIIILCSVVISYTPPSSINGRNVYTIYNFTEINATYFSGDGSGLTNVYSSSSNRSEYWGDLGDSSEITVLGTITTGKWKASLINDSYLEDFDSSKLLNITFLNYMILSDWDNITNKFIESVDNDYLYMSSTQLTQNETRLNETIEILITDLNTSYSAGTGLTLTDVTFSFDQSWGDSVYITAVNTNGQYLTGGASSGDVNLLLDESILNSTIDERASELDSSFMTDLFNDTNPTLSADLDLNSNNITDGILRIGLYNSSCWEIVGETTNLRIC